MITRKFKNKKKKFKELEMILKKLKINLAILLIYVQMIFWLTMLVRVIHHDLGHLLSLWVLSLIPRIIYQIMEFMIKK